MTQEHYYHKSLLNKRLQSLYTLMESQLTAHSATVKLPFAQDEDILQVLKALQSDKPFLSLNNQFLLNSDGSEVWFKPSYIYSNEEMKKYQAAVFSSFSRLDAAQGKSAYDKALCLHDHILRNVKYDNTSAPVSHTAQGVAVNKQGVCEGIAKYAKIALDYLAVNNIVVVGTATEPTQAGNTRKHAWNMVEINNDWYHLDITFDVTLAKSHCRYDYFLVTDADIQHSHKADEQISTTGIKKIDYYTVNGLNVTNSQNLRQILSLALAKGHKNIQFKVLSESESTERVQNVLRIAKEECINILKCHFELELRFNCSLWVFELEVKR